MLRCLTFVAVAMLAAPVVAGSVAGPVRPNVAVAGFRKLVERRGQGEPTQYVRDLPMGPPHVTVASPVAGNLALSYYGIFGADAGLDFAQMRDRQGFIGLNWLAADGAIYLVDCELPGAEVATVVEVAIDGGGWLPATVSGGHLLYAVPALAPFPGNSTHAFAMRSTGTGFHGCEVSKVK